MRGQEKTFSFWAVKAFCSLTMQRSSSHGSIHWCGGFLGVRALVPWVPLAVKMCAGYVSLALPIFSF